MTSPRLVLLDRDGVVIVNRRRSIRSPADLAFIPGAPAAIRKLTEAGVRVSICANLPEVARGIVSRQQLDCIHTALQAKLAAQGALVDLVLCSTSVAKSPCLKPGPGMIRQALAYHGAAAAETPFVGDQLDDLRAAFHAGCPRILVRTGLGRKTLADRMPDYVRPVLVADDLSEAVDTILGLQPPNRVRS